MKGRKPQANAIRRGGQEVQRVQAAIVDKPISVMAVPNMSDMWDVIVGSGLAYKPEDAPMLEQLVFDLELARQCRDKCIDELGNIRAMVGKGEPDPVTGEYLDMAPNPYIKQMREAVSEAMKLADQLGCTPLARARLGLTQAAGKALTLSIAEQVDAALSRSK